MTEDEVARLIAGAVEAERKRTADLIRAVLGNPVGDHVGYEETFREDWARTFAILADRIERDPVEPSCDGCGHPPHDALLCHVASCNCDRHR